VGETYSVTEKEGWDGGYQLYYSVTPSDGIGVSIEDTTPYISPAPVGGSHYYQYTFTAQKTGSYLINIWQARSLDDTSPISQDTFTITVTN